MKSVYSFQTKTNVEFFYGTFWKYLHAFNPFELLEYIVFASTEVSRSLFDLSFYPAFF